MIKNLILDIKITIQEYWLRAKARWEKFTTTVKSAYRELIGKPPKKKGRPKKANKDG